MKRKFLRGLPVMLAVLLIAGVAQAGAVTTDIWYSFSFSGAPVQPGIGTSAYGLTNPGGQFWTYTSASATSVTITDLEADIDYFRLYNNLIAVGDTPFPDFIHSACGGNPDACIADGYSSATFILAAGSYSLSIDQLGTSRGGTGAFRLASVPEPGTLLLLGSGLFGLACLRRRV